MFSNTTDEIRSTVVKKYDKIIKNIKLSRCIEQNIYNYTINQSKKKNIKRYWENDIFKNLYLSKIISIYSNLDKNCYIKNEHFLERIKNKEIDYKKICELYVYDIFPENWKEYLNKKAKKDKLKYSLKPEAMTTLFKCNRCKSRECSFYEVQTRSADEPMTQFITCLKCNARWKQ